MGDDGARLRFGSVVARDGDTAAVLVDGGTVGAFVPSSLSSIRPAGVSWSADTAWIAQQGARLTVVGFWRP